MLPLDSTILLQHEKIPLLLLLAEDEWKQGNILIKELNTETQHTVPYKDMIPFVKDLAERNPVLLKTEQIKNKGEE